MILVDDVLALRMLTNGALVIDDDEVATTCTWWWRLASTIHGSRGGFLSRRIERQPAPAGRAIRRAVDHLPERFAIIDLRRLLPAIGPLAGEHGLNLLSAEALTAATILGADIVVGQDAPGLREAARVRGVTYLVEA